MKLPCCHVWTATEVVSVCVLVLLCALCTHPSATIINAHAQTVATGTPINFGSLGDYRTNTQLGGLLNAAAFGMNLSFALHNNFRNGVKGRPLKLHIRYTNDDASTVPALMDDLMANVSDLVGLAHSLGDVTIANTVAYIDALPEDSKMVLIQPSAGVRQWFEYSKSYINLIPPADAEMFAGIRYFIHHHQFSRIAVVTDVGTQFGTELMPDIRRLLSEVGATLSYHYTLNLLVDPNNYDIPQLQALVATNPHAVLLNSALYPNTAATLVALLVSLPEVYVITVTGLMPLVDLALRQLPFKGIIKGRMLCSNVGPLHSDGTNDIVQRFRTELNSLATPQMNLTVIDSSPSIGTFVFFGWVIGELIVKMLDRVDDGVTAVGLRRSIFRDSIYSIDDFVLGPYSGDCTGVRTLYCQCNNGARIVNIVQFTEEFTLTTTPLGLFTLPLASCDASGLSLPSPLVIATITPASSPEATRVANDYLVGRNANAIVGDVTIDGALIEQTYVGNSTAVLQALNTERLLTASAGSVLNVPIGSSTGVGAIVDPLEVRPRLYSGYRREVVHVSPTYEQELHTLALLAVDRQMGIRVLSALDDDGEAVGETLTRSMHTLGKEGGGSQSVVTIAEGLGSMGDGGMLVLHGIATSTDISAIAIFLARTSTTVLAVPMAHLLVWYDELVAAVTEDAHRSRIVFATSLPNWAGPVSGTTTGAALQTYFDRVPPTNRTPGSLRGFMIQQLLMYVSSRIPQVQSSDEFLRMLYGASVIVMDTGLVAGPYFDAVCSKGVTDSCEVNIGARLVRVRSVLSSMATANGTVAGRDELSTTFDSGHIVYTELPTADNTLRNITIIVSIMGGVVVGIGLLVLLLMCCSGRSNWSAPKVESEAFTIVFTDIQSSTLLWATVPEAMAPALDHHHLLVRKLCSQHHGYEVKTIGDAFMIAFRVASDAVNFASALQLNFYADKGWGSQIDHAYLEMDHTITQGLKSEERAMYSISLSQDGYCTVWNGLRVRIGIHTGYGEIKKDPVSQGYDYYGTIVNVAARTEAIGHGGQVVMTGAALAASNVCPERVTAMGPVTLRGVPDPVQMYQLTTVANRVFPPFRVEKADQDTHVDSQEVLCPSLPSEASLAHLSPTKQQQYIVVQDMITTMIGVMPERAKVEWLAGMCKHWRVAIPPPTAMNSRGYSDKEVMINGLVGKLSAVLAKKGGGGFGLIKKTNRASVSTRADVFTARSMSGLKGQGSSLLGALEDMPGSGVSVGSSYSTTRGGGERGRRNTLGSSPQSSVDPMLPQLTPSQPAESLWSPLNVDVEEEGAGANGDDLCSSPTKECI